jgi:molecular chaperone HscB
MDESIRYVLELKKMLPDDRYEYSPQFIMEVRDINEELMELEIDEKQEQLMEVEQKVNTLLTKIYEDVEPVIESYKEETASEETLLQVKDFYFEKKYLQRILDRINVIRNITSP